MTAGTWWGIGMEMKVIGGEGSLSDKLGVGKTWGGGRMG